MMLPPMVCTALDTVETLMRRAQAINRLTEAQQDRLATALPDSTGCLGRVTRRGRPPGGTFLTD